MDEKIEVSLSRIETIIGSFRGKVSFKTSDVVREYSGGFYSNVDTPAAYSFNAQFGKLLKRNADALKISEVKKGVSVKDDNDHPTTTSEWRSTSSWLII